MAFEGRKIGAARLRAKSAYERFMESEGVPMVGGFGVTALRDIVMARWRRLGCDGAYLNFFGSDGVTGLYAGKILPGGGTLPERHLYEKIFYILEGEGVAEIQQRDHVPQNLRWQAGSLFSPPINTLHRLINDSSRPVLFLAVTTAPLALDHYRNEQFIFNSDFVFVDRYDAEADYFTANERRYSPMDHRQWMHQANYIADVRELRRDAKVSKAGRVNITRFEMANNSLIGQLVEWPVGRYRKAHCRSGGVVLVILRSSGYSLMWPSHIGTQPYKSGQADQVVRLDWSPGSIFCPPPNWFHQHFHTGKEPAQTLAFFCGSVRFPMTRHVDGANAARNPLGGPSAALAPFDDDDPSIRQLYQTELAKNGVEVKLKGTTRDD